MPASAFRLLALCVLLAPLGACGGEPDAPAAPAPAAEAAFVGDEACASCHAEVYTSYHRTGMGRSLGRFDPATAPERFDAAGRGTVVESPADGYYYRAFVRADTLYQREWRTEPGTGADGPVTHELVRRVDYVVGSGNATRSYLHDANGYLTEAPLTWYVERGIWAMSPGYEAANLRFARPITLECMTCHNARPGFSAFTQNHFTDVPLGISCERCHGPGGAHVDARLADGAPAEGGDPTIVNPARLGRGLQLAACQQCHLEGTAVFQPGHDPTTYRPGMPLAATRAVYVPDGQVDDPERFGIASHGKRLAQSACYQQSAMTCTTCHDPHRPNAELGPDAFNAACRSCHGGAAAQVPAGATPAPAHEAVCARPGVHGAELMTGDCAGCHMVRGGTSDIPHVTFTDHWIRRTVPPAPPVSASPDRGLGPEPVRLVELTAQDAGAEAAATPAAAPVAERVLDEAVAYFHLWETRHHLPQYLPEIARGIRSARAAGADRADARLALARTLLARDSVAAAVRVLEDARAAYPQDAWVAYWLGDARLRQGRAADARAALDAAVAIQPLLVEARVKRAEALGEEGRADDAIAELEAAVRLDPMNHPTAWNNLGFARLQRGDLAAAERDLRRAVQLDPDLIEARANWATALLLLDRDAEAAGVLETAVAQRPDYAPARGNLGLAYLRLGRPADARRQFEALLARNPADQQARAYLQQLDANR